MSGRDFVIVTGVRIVLDVVQPESALDGIGGGGDSGENLDVSIGMLSGGMKMERCSLNLDLRGSVVDVDGEEVMAGRTRCR